MAKKAETKQEPKQERTKTKWQVRTVKPESMDIGEVIEGRLLDIQPGKLSDIFCIHVPGQGVKRIWSSTVLANSINRQDVGKQIKIKYKGEEKSSGGRNVKIYDVFVEDLD